MSVVRSQKLSSLAAVPTMRRGLRKAMIAVAEDVRTSCNGDRVCRVGNGVQDGYGYLGGRKRKEVGVRE